MTINVRLILLHARFLKSFKRFQTGLDDVEDDSHPSHPSTSKTVKNFAETVRIKRYLG